MYLSITAFNPVADGETPDTDCFQQAIDTVAAAGGGTLSIAPGRYLLGSLVLPSYFCLHLEAGATLIASSDLHDYQHLAAQTHAELSHRVLLYAVGQQQVSITGQGRIWGNADRWFAREADEQGYRLPLADRPRMVVFEACRQLRLRDFTIEHAPMWTVHLVSCENVWVQGLRIDNDLTMANTDALDIDSCENVHISDCYLSAADDGICIKTTAKPAGLRRKTRNVTVTGSILRSNSCALKIGTETFDDVEDVVVSGCTIFASNRGIGLLCRDGGSFRRLIFSNITFQCTSAPPVHWGRSDPIFISVRPRNPQIVPGVVEYVQFSNITGVAEGAINLHSEVRGQIHHISFQHILMQQRLSDRSEQGFYDIRPPCNPANPTGMGLDNAWALNPASGRAWGVEPYPGGLPGFYASGVSELSLTGVEIVRPQPLPSGWNRQSIVID
ncbi:glycoside hydrolase family 28 protein [Pantoea sp. B65]|uniref:glycoside hydrolase family 28 protein n=1 Tax=Pantoea sp. B65 TaxID=2813359 RepID=UPI0039B6484C